MNDIENVEPAATAAVAAEKAPRDLSNIVSHNIFYEVKDPADESPLGLTVELLPTDHPLLKKQESANRTQRNRLAARGKAFTDPQAEELTLRYLQTAIVGWQFAPGVTWSGMPNGTTFSPVNVKFALGHQWFRDQIDEALGDTSRFFRE